MSPQPHTTYRDVSADLQAAARAHYAPELRADLLHLGFAPAGLLEARPFGPVARDPFERRFAAADVESLIEGYKQHGTVIELLASPDGRTLAGVERWFGGPVVCMRTLAADGAVVETVMWPARPPRRAAVHTRKDTNPLHLMGRALDRLADLAFESVLDPGPLWLRESRPGAGYYLELLDTRDVAALWERHRTRVEDFARERRATFPPHHTSALWLAMGLRAQHVAGYLPHGQHFLESGAIVVSMAAILAALWIATGLIRTVPLLQPFTLYIGALFVIAGSIPVLRAYSFVQRTLSPRLAGAPLEPAAELLQSVQFL